MRGATTHGERVFYTRRFQFTPLMRGATRRNSSLSSQGDVSIHAPHARGDLPVASIRRSIACFNSRPSCEGRLNTYWITPSRGLFQFTPLMRGATARFYFFDSKCQGYYFPRIGQLKVIICPIDEWYKTFNIQNQYYTLCAAHLDIQCYLVIRAKLFFVMHITK